MEKLLTNSKETGEKKIFTKWHINPEPELQRP